MIYKDRILANLTELLNRSKIYKQLLVNHGMVHWLIAVDKVEETLMNNLPCRCFQLKEIGNKLHGYLKVAASK